MKHITQITGKVGYFLDHVNMFDVNVYPDEMAYVVNMQNVTATTLSPECLAAVGPGNEYQCYMAPHVQAFVHTPFFVMNSRFDMWQMVSILQPPCMVGRSMCNATEQQAIVQCVNWDAWNRAPGADPAVQVRPRLPDPAATCHRAARSRRLQCGAGRFFLKRVV